MKESNDEPIRNVLQKMLVQYKLKAKVQQVQINKLWTNIMGPSIASYTKDIVLRRGKLYITITSAPLKQELSYGKDKIKNLINEKLGEESVKEVYIR